MSLPVLMDKGIVRHIIRSSQDRNAARDLLGSTQVLSNVMPLNSIIVELVGITNLIDASIRNKILKLSNIQKGVN